MAHAIARYLIDFNLGTPPKEAPEPELTPVLPPSRDSAEDIEDMIRAAEERGRQEGEARARRDFEAALASERQRAAHHLEQAHRQWTQETAERLALQVPQALHDLEVRLGDALARAVAPLIGEALRRRMLDELSATLSDLLADQAGLEIRVTGPEDLLQALAERLGPLRPRMTFEPGDTGDVRVQADDTVIETQMTAWAERLARAVPSSSIEPS